MVWIISIGIFFFFSVIGVTTGHTSEALYFLLLTIGMIEVMKFLLEIDIRKAIAENNRRETHRIKATAEFIENVGKELEKKQKESSANG